MTSNNRNDGTSSHVQSSHVQSSPASGGGEQEQDVPIVTSSLHAAMRMADVVRNRLHERSAFQNTANGNPHNQREDFRVTPGMLEGATAGALSLLALTPVRSALLRRTGQRLGVLPDLIVTTSQIMVSVNAALYYGSLYGSYHYLQTFTKIPPTAKSPTVDKICHESLKRFHNFYQTAAVAATDASQSSSTSWKSPKEIVLTEFIKAMELCREREDGMPQQQQQQQQQQQRDQMTWWRKG